MTISILWNLYLFTSSNLFFICWSNKTNIWNPPGVFPPFYIKKCHKDFANLEHDVMVTMKLLCFLLLTISCSFYFNKNMSKCFWESINTQKWPYISSKNSILIENAHFNFTFIERWAKSYFNIFPFFEVLLRF